MNNNIPVFVYRGTFGAQSTYSNTTIVVFSRLNYLICEVLIVSLRHDFLPNYKAYISTR